MQEWNPPVKMTTTAVDLDLAMEELALETKIERLHADIIDRVERYINTYHGGTVDMRTLIRVIIKQLEKK